MFHPAYEKMVQFASEGELESELTAAREQYVVRTGDLFESDESYERRLGAFLEWYVLDRPVSVAQHLTPAKMYIDSVRDGLTTPEVNDLRQLTRTVLSVFEFKKAKTDNLRFINLLTNEKVDIFERRKPAGLESGDLLEARLVPNGERMMLSETVRVLPRAARKSVMKTAKVFRKAKDENGRIDLVHRVEFLHNKCARYAHLDPKDIFAELENGHGH